MEEKKYLSTTELANILGISRITVFKRIKSGQLKAQKVGRNFIIDKKELPNILGKALTESQKRTIENAVEKTIREYGQALKLLGRE
ncbi:MAG: helix-turn-helix domain-containing protein [Candidatus Portnoybacteria bacterium]|nr:helix-turn-helix domain-containing protein [Candidatus Portnoybacteria bacterium]